MNRFLNDLIRVEKTTVTDTKKVVEKVSVTAAVEVVETALPIAANFFPILAPLVPLAKFAGAKILEEKDLSKMNSLEAFAVTLILGMLQQVVKNPAHKAALQSQLTGIATDIFLAYGMVPPPAPAPTLAATGGTAPVA